MRALEDIRRCRRCEVIFGWGSRCPRCQAVDADDPSLARYLESLQTRLSMPTPYNQRVGRLHTLLRRLRHVEARAAAQRNDFDVAETSALGWAISQLSQVYPNEYRAACRRAKWTPNLPEPSP